ncbi:uncharacterized protein LOC126379533 [Pectinophora gossypiella]|uniref:uncharacterized protein LOC126379533 n=1 Tax=Pectinophora gossypiella TaxID=13191 RepID=UPI00214F2869|nr:uncharacterized protein LOC126379533 [Pectinophora gossypiella]
MQFAKKIPIVFMLFTCICVTSADKENCLDVRDDEVFEGQVDALVRRVRMPRAQVGLCEELKQDLQRHFRRLWPDCKLEVFGSIPKGLALVTSDIDLYVHIPDVKDTPGNLVRIAADILKIDDSYKIIGTFPDNEVPLLKLRHEPTGQPVDVVFSHFNLKTENELIKYLFYADHRTLKLMVVIKHWTNMHQIAVPPFMPGVSWSLMVIFYLQQINIFPPINELQKDTPPEMLENWNVAFEQHFKYIYPSENNDSLYKLLGGFFSYYADFDFENNMISIFLGSPVKRELFKKIETVPDVFDLYKYNVKNNLSDPINNLDAHFCIQRPFMHNCNIAKDDAELAIKIKKHLKEATNIYKVTTREEFLPTLLSINL